MRTLCRYKGVEIIEGHLMSDHVHMLVMIPPKLSVSSFIGYLKGKFALMIFDRHANLKYKYGNRHFWAEGYYVSTVGLNDQTVAKYINEWMTLKAVIEDEKATFYLNDDPQPLLVVDQMIHDKSMRGNIGFFVDIGTEAFFKDLKITYFD